MAARNKEIQKQSKNIETGFQGTEQGNDTD